ncbi:hypothetical protein SAMN05444695_12226 [Rhodococcus triatomae]|uniref:Secreted protein n=1 Tax=Rhodococcus triatomae TaxID=300028 RepID=A0A1G8SL84_9NOCA|nr:hypothetical protein SAMN05444695_12226 [Rhodococcus triatomae]
MRLVIRAFTLLTTPVTVRRIGTLAVSGALLAMSGLMAASATAAAEVPETAAPQSCVIDENDRAATVDTLLHRCTSEEIIGLFEAAPVGVAPEGTLTITLLPVYQLDGRIIGYDNAQKLSTAQNRLGDSLTFTTGPSGEPWVYKDYVWGRDAGGPVVPGTSRIDGKPAWTADFSRDFGGIPISVHEYRQLTPDVWIGRDIGGVSSARANGPTGGAIVLS